LFLQLLENFSENDEAFLDSGTHISEASEVFQPSLNSQDSPDGDGDTQESTFGTLPTALENGSNHGADEIKVHLSFEAISPSQQQCKGALITEPIDHSRSSASISSPLKLPTPVTRKDLERLSTASLGSVASSGHESVGRRIRSSLDGQAFRSPDPKRHDRHFVNGLREDKPLSGQMLVANQRYQDEQHLKSGRTGALPQVRPSSLSLAVRILLRYGPSNLLRSVCWLIQALCSKERT
jgi:hypothetical protein